MLLFQSLFLQSYPLIFSQKVFALVTIILGAASTMTNESVPSTGKVGQEVWNIIINC